VSDAKPKLPPAPPRPDPRVILRRAPDGVAAEELRTLAARVEAIAVAGRPRIGITSADRGDGRTTVAANLALAMGTRQRVLLVEADLRHPSLNQAFGLVDGGGVAEVVAGRATLEQAAFRIETGPIDILPAGAAGQAHAVVGAPRMRQLLTDAGARFPVVVVDLPPALDSADVLTLAPALDGIVLVARAGHTLRERFRRAAASLPPALLVGAVLIGA
jgi:Mrp family chromosome partitioning ATPase